MPLYYTYAIKMPISSESTTQPENLAPPQTHQPKSGS
jgi:hypothetical protein